MVNEIRHSRAGGNPENQTLYAFCIRNFSSFREYFFNRAVKNLFALWVVAGIVFVCGAVSQIGMARVLGPHALGQLAVWLAWGGCAVTLTRCGREITILRDLVQNPNDTPRILAATATLYAFTGTILIVSLGIAKLIFPALPLAAMLVVFAFVISALDLVPLYDAHRQMRRHAARTLSARFVHYLLIWPLLIFLPAASGLLLIGAALVTSHLFLLWLLVRDKLWRETLRAVRLQLGTRETFIATRQLFSSHLILAVVAFLDVLFIPAITGILAFAHGMVAVGTYYVGGYFLTLAMLMWQQVARIGNPAMAQIAAPQIAATNQENSNANTQQKIILCVRYFALLSLCCTLCAAPLIFFSQEIITLLLPRYLDAIPLLPIFGLIILLEPPRVILYQYLVAARCDRALGAGRVIESLVTLTAALILIPQFGLLGAMGTHFVHLCMTYLVRIPLVIWQVRQSKFHCRTQMG